MLTPVDRQRASGAAVAGGVVTGLLGFGAWVVVTIAVAYGASNAMGDSAGTVVVLAMVLLPLAAAVLLLAMPGTRAAARASSVASAGGFLLGAVGAWSSSGRRLLPLTPTPFGGVHHAGSGRRTSMETMGINDVEDRAMARDPATARSRTGGTVTTRRSPRSRASSAASPS